MASSTGVTIQPSIDNIVGSIVFRAPSKVPTETENTWLALLPVVTGTSAADFFRLACVTNCVEAAMDILKRFEAQIAAASRNDEFVYSCLSAACDNMRREPKRAEDMCCWLCNLTTHTGDVFWGDFVGMYWPCLYVRVMMAGGSAWMRATGEKPVWLDFPSRNPTSIRLAVASGYAFGVQPEQLRRAFGDDDCDRYLNDGIRAMIANEMCAPQEVIRRIQRACAPEHITDCYKEALSIALDVDDLPMAATFALQLADDIGTGIAACVSCYATRRFDMAHTLIACFKFDEPTLRGCLHGAICTALYARDDGVAGLIQALMESQNDQLQVSELRANDDELLRVAFETNDLDAILKLDELVQYRPEMGIDAFGLLMHACAHRSVPLVEWVMSSIAAGDRAPGEMVALTALWCTAGNNVAALSPVLTKYYSGVDATDATA